jgi:hypothetical protein
MLRAMKPLSLSLMLALWTTAAAAADNIQVFFSPHGGCTEAVVERISATQRDQATPCF